MGNPLAPDFINREEMPWPKRMGNNDWWKSNALQGFIELELIHSHETVDNQFYVGNTEGHTHN